MSFAELAALLQRTLPDARIEPTTLPDCGGIRLGLINADYPIGPLEPDVMRAVIESPAYWAFCWGSGLALARHLHAQPGWVRGKRVVDLGSGSGVCAIAAARCGARKVIACDSDPDALAATRINGIANGVNLELLDDLDRVPRDVDLLIMSDVLYDASNLRLLEAARGHTAEMLVADSRVRQLPDPQFREIERIDACTYPNLGEFDEFRTVHLFHWPGQG